MSDAGGEARNAGDVTLPTAVDVASLPTTDSTHGLVLTQRDSAGGCVVLTYADGHLQRRGTFPAFTATHAPPTAGSCEERWVYSGDYGTRVGEIYANYVNDNSFDVHVVAQQIGQPERDVSGTKELSWPVVGPEDKLYVVAGNPYDGKPSIMNLDGSGLTAVADGESRPAWLGGTLVHDGLKALANSTGSLAVEYIEVLPDGSSGYRVGSVAKRKAYGPAIDGDIVAPSGGEASMPLAWVGDNQFLTSGAGVVYLNTVTAGPNPSVTVKTLATLPEQYMSSANPVSRIVVCGDTAYWTVSLGGTQALPDKQFALLGASTKDGTLTAYTSILSPNSPSDTYRTEVMSCSP